MAIDLLCGLCAPIIVYGQSPLSGSREREEREGEKAEEIAGAKKLFEERAGGKNKDAFDGGKKLTLPTKMHHKKSAI